MTNFGHSFYVNFQQPLILTYAQKPLPLNSITFTVHHKYNIFLKLVLSKIYT